MFESAEIGHKVGKEEYRREEPMLREALLDAQYDLLNRRKFPVIVLVNGVDGAGKGETVNLFNEWMDPRHILTHAFGALSDEERDRPEMWRFWRVLPPKGKIGILFGSWYTDPILRRVMGNEKRALFERRLERVRHFERMLVAEGAVVVKLWFHLSKKAQIKRFKALSANKETAWRVPKDDRERFEHYDEFKDVCEDVLRNTSIGETPWNVIEGEDAHYRSLTAGRLLLDAVRVRLRAVAGATGTAAAPTPASVPVTAAEASETPSDELNLLRALDYSAQLTREEYEKRLSRAQAKLNGLTRHKKMQDRSVINVFEGMDAAGKGSTIRRLTQAMDARFYRIIPVAAPTDEERAQPYLWRFWRHVPRHGRCVIFDRSWYGRVLVERVEGFCGVHDWKRAYGEINDFEEQLTEAGAIVVKFWLAVTPEEQLRRFKERENTPHKRFKITAEDWRNREKWPLYERAICDMVDRTSTDHSPWNLIASNDKLHARVEVLERLCELIETRL